MDLEVKQEITLTVRGEVGEAMKDLARERVGRVCTQVHEPVLFVEVKLTHEPDPARQRPNAAEAVLTLSHTTLRAHVAADTMTAALDLLDDQLRHRLDRYTSIRSDRKRHGPQGHVDGDRAWHHGDLPTQRPEHFKRPVDDRELVRHKSFAVGYMTPDEAADLLDLVGHAFLLFTNANTDADAVIWHSRDNGLELIDASDHADIVGAATVAPIRASKIAVRHCSVAQAIEELDLDLEPFVFFIDDTAGRGQVAYHRYDGHYGLITPA